MLSRVIGKLHRYIMYVSLKKTSTVRKFPNLIQRNSNNKFIIEFQNEIKPEEFKEKLKLTEKLNDVLEKMIIKNPNQWIWTHNRWK